MKPPDALKSCCFAMPAKRISVFLLVAVLSFSSFSQTTDISGIVNTYHKVIEVIPAKACLRVANTTGLNVNTRVMVVQMRGATMQTTTGSAHGDTIALNGAGNYEIGTICYMIGDSVFLFHHLLNSYDVASKVQLVQFAEYYSANVVDTVKALSWDSTAGIGGVIAIFADQDITLNRPIYADSSGYAGGIWHTNNPSCPPGNLYAYDITSTNQNNGAYKGEGVANIDATLNSAKGAPANGGGGGNNHNNSGAGGANLRAGGDGGGNSSSAPFSCIIVTGNYGRKGKPLSSWGGTKLFMGGGAGAGHSNNGAVNFNYGGNGGGLIFLWATNLTGNGYSISANGGRGGNSQADGAGGGGAGGSIIMHIGNYIGPATISANGGNGGDSYNDISTMRCFGGGGGGSGGAVYFTGATPSPGITVNISAGSGGQEFDRHGSCNAAIAGASGVAGDIFPNYTFRRSTNTAGYCLLLLPSKLLFFNAQLIAGTVNLNWEVEHPDQAYRFIIEKRMGSDWVELASIAAVDSRYKYNAADASPSPGNNYYRLKVIEIDNSHYYSPIRKIWNGQGSADFTIYPNPSSGKVFISGSLQAGEFLKLLDASGKLIWQQKIQNILAEIRLPVLPAGLYLVQHGNTIKKLLIR